MHCMTGSSSEREVVETTCVDVDAEGLCGICIHETEEGRRRAIFVPGALPGAVLRVAIDGGGGGAGVPGTKSHRRKRRLTYGTAVEVMKHHNGKVEPHCVHFGECGGCTLQQVSYIEQLGIKKEKIKNAFERIGGLSSHHVGRLQLQVEASPAAYRYRNRVEFSVADGRFGKHRRGSTDLVPISGCSLQGEDADRCYRYIVDFMEGSVGRGMDLIEYVVIRATQAGDLLVNVATRARADDLLSGLSVHLREHFPSLRGMVNSVLVENSPVGLRQVQDVHVLFGYGYLEERLGDLIFKVSANSFFQVNTPMTELLYRHIVDAAGVRSSDVVYDLFCGSGTIALFLAKHSAATPKSIVGVELAQGSVVDALENARMNRVDIATFVHGDVGDVCGIVKRGGYARPDIVVVDPARAGLSKRALEGILDLAPRTLVYVSCDVTTQARDVKRLMESGKYQVTQLKGFDLYVTCFSSAHPIPRRVLGSSHPTLRTIFTGIRKRPMWRASVP